MSRGPGRMMRYALDYLRKKKLYAESWTSLYVVAWAYEKHLLTEQTGAEVRGYDVHVTYSGREALRRAIKSLERDGLVETCQLWYPPGDDHRYWGELHYRLSEQEREKLSVDNSPTLSPEEAGQAVQQLSDLLGGAQ